MVFKRLQKLIKERPRSSKHIARQLVPKDGHTIGRPLCRSRALHQLHSVGGGGDTQKSAAAVRRVLRSVLTSQACLKVVQKRTYVIKMCIYIYIYIFV